MNGGHKVARTKKNKESTKEEVKDFKLYVGYDQTLNLAKQLLVKFYPEGTELDKERFDSLYELFKHHPSGVDTFLTLEAYYSNERLTKEQLLEAKVQIDSVVSEIIKLGYDLGKDIILYFFKSVLTDYSEEDHWIVSKSLDLTIPF